MATTLHLIGVSAGDATLIEHVDGDRVYHILVDGGLNKRTTLEYLLNRDIRRLDLVIASHLDYDHLGGLLPVFNERSINVGEFWTFDISILKSFLETGVVPQRLQYLERPNYVLDLMTAHDIQRECEIRGILCKQVTAGHVARFGGLIFEVLYPTQDYLDYLYRPRTLAVMLERRRVPLEWKIGKHEYAPETISEEGKRRPYQRLSFPKEDPSIREWERAAREQYEEWTQSDDSLQEVMSRYWAPDEVSPGYRDEAEMEVESSWDDLEGPLEICNDKTIMNDLSAVFRVSSVGRDGFRSVLFTGDLENWTSLILSEGFRLRSDVLKVPHHGSEGVGWNPRAATRFIENRWEEWYLEDSLCLWAEYYFPYRWWPRILRRTRYLGGFGDILDLVRPEQAILFPFPRFRLPRKDVLDQLQDRRIDVFANRPEGVNLASSSVEPQSRLLVLDP